VTIPTEVIMRMATLGLNEAQAKAVAEMLSTVEQATAAEGEAGKEKARERWRRWKAKQPVTNDDKRLQTTANADQHSRDRVAPVDDKLKPIDTNTSQNTTSKDHSEFRGVLASLDAEQVVGLIKIRKAKKAPVTGYAASLFVKAAATCGLSVPEAADMCIERNWLTVKPEWMPSARGSPPHRQASFADALAAVATEAEYRNDPRHSPSDESPGRVVPYLPRVQSG
jgi:hypothetical protein